MGAPAPPQGGEKIFFRSNLQEKCVSAPRRTRSTPPASFLKKFLGQFLLGGLDLEVYLDGRGRRLKKVVNFFGQKVHTPDKILATPMGWRKRARTPNTLWQVKWSWRGHRRQWECRWMSRYRLGSTSDSWQCSTSCHTTPTAARSPSTPLGSRSPTPAPRCRTRSATRPLSEHRIPRLQRQIRILPPQIFVFEIHRRRQRGSGGAPRGCNAGAPPHLTACFAHISVKTAHIFLKNLPQISINFVSRPHPETVPDSTWWTSAAVLLTALTAQGQLSLPSLRGR